MNPGEGSEYPDAIFGSPDETFHDFKLRQFEQYESSNPASGWCADGKTKIVLTGATVGKLSDLYICISANELVLAYQQPQTTVSTSIADPAPKAICPDIDLTDIPLTMEKLFLSILQKTGPSDGACSSKNMEVWKMDGSSFNLPSKCFCVPKPNVPGSVMK